MAAMRDTKLVETFGAVASRRRVLRMLGGAAAAAVVATGLGAPAAAKRKEAAGARNGSPSGKASRSGETAQRAGVTTVTRTFTNSRPITIYQEGRATPYPSPILVDGFEAATLTDVNLTLIGFGHTHPMDVDILLVAPDDHNALVMSDTGSISTVTDLTIRFDDQAGSNVPLYPSPLTSGTFRPTNANDSSGEDDFDLPAPPPSGKVALSTFQGSDPNGVWQLFIRNDGPDEPGSISGGWQLEITATAPKKKKRKKKKHKKKKH